MGLLRYGSTRVMATGWRRGLTGSGAWLSVALAMSALKLLRRWGAREEQLVFRQRLQPGEALVLRNVEPAPSRR